MLVHTFPHSVSSYVYLIDPAFRKWSRKGANFTYKSHYQPNPRWYSSVAFHKQCNRSQNNSWMSGYNQKQSRTFVFSLCDSFPALSASSLQNMLNCWAALSTRHLIGKNSNFSKTACKLISHINTFHANTNSRIQKFNAEPACPLFWWSPLSSGSELQSLPGLHMHQPTASRSQQLSRRLHPCPAFGVMWVILVQSRHAGIQT